MTVGMGPGGPRQLAQKVREGESTAAEDLVGRLKVISAVGIGHN